MPTNKSNVYGLNHNQVKV